MIGEENEKIRIFVGGEEGFEFEEGVKSLLFHVRKKDFLKQMELINSKYSEWKIIIVYVKDLSNTELARYYNFDDRKTFPQSINEIL